MEDQEMSVLKQLRLAHGYTQQEVADVLGVTKAAVSKYENGQREMRRTHVEKLCQLYQVEPTYLLMGETAEAWRRRLDDERVRAEREERAYWESALLTDEVRALLPLLEALNEAGRQKAVERVEELTEIARYRK